MDEATESLITLALREDLGPSGDVTSAAVLGPAAGCAGRLAAREPIVLAGLEVARAVFARVDPGVRFQSHLQDGTAVEAGRAVAEISGSARSVLAAERTALNFLQRLCGVATLTSRYVAKLAGTRCRLLDTRKTTPGWRALEKAAVRAGGGHNHRMGLFDGVLIKDNHVAAAGGVRPAVEAARRGAGALLKIELEVDTLEQLREALGLGVEVVLLDNMKPDTLAAAVKLREELAPKTLLEASGGVTLENLAAIAATGVDFVSSGALTHSARAVDIGLDLD
ncbi:MAG TPA: carboxylating nicotinate-nucleotide diphosphorylase [Myxococcales bacterium]|nr:carboxylating nicotinate-nucleotide diphosphorylase [Myxococcales bacterium]